jgi:hypothetical protein
MRNLALLIALGPSTLWAGDPVWEPAKTWVFAVGVLNYDDPGLQGWPDEGRVDARLLETLKKRGVPQEQIVFIKNKEATKERLAHELVEFLKQPGEDDMLLFYYTGHGSRDYSDLSRPVSFLTYDSKSTWTVSSVLDAIDEHFKGSQVLLAADCCHSGALAEEAARRSGKISYGVLTSAHSNSVSTGNWTFTQCLVDLFAGSAVLDADGDGLISFQEAAEYCDAEMSFCEDQRATHAALGDFSKQLVLARAEAKQPPRVGERCEGQFRGIWMKGKIVQAKEGKYLVHWIDRDKMADTWLEPERLRPYEPTSLEAGMHVRIEWNGEWFKGKILEARHGLHLVHYVGFPSADNEWVPLRRLRPQP